MDVDRAAAKASWASTRTGGGQKSVDGLGEQQLAVAPYIFGATFKYWPYFYSCSNTKQLQQQ